MYFDSLYQNILLEPILNKNCDKLLIVSGYATAAMAFHYLNDLRNNYAKEIEVDLIVGMTSKDGITASNHIGFRKLVSEDFFGKFKCRYIVKSPPVHSKIYLWCKNTKPSMAFTGSANYTQKLLKS